MYVKYKKKKMYFPRLFRMIQIYASRLECVFCINLYYIMHDVCCHNIIIYYRETVKKCPIIIKLEKKLLSRFILK